MIESPLINNKFIFKIHDKIYDLSNFIHIHPGGIDMFNNLKTNTNITPLLYSYHKNPKSILTNILPKYEILSQINNIKFETNYSYEKYCELKKLVYDEIHEKKIPLYWTFNEIFYNFSMLSLYISVWIYCFLNNQNLSSLWFILLSIMNTGICNLIFHETSHYCGFKNQQINKYLTLCAYPNMIADNWKFIHNFNHHCFTNTEYDTDFNYSKHALTLRHSKDHTFHSYNQFQSFYCLLMFSTVFFYRGFIKSIKMRTLNCFCGFIMFFYFGFYKTIIWYSLCGFLFAFIAQLSHIQHECIEINTENKNDYLYNQVSSSMNYKTNNFITRFLCFGLDIQIEHHLFPNIPHSSLRKIKPIVRNFCVKNNIPYIEQNNILSSIISYIFFLYKMSKP